MNTIMILILGILTLCGYPNTVDTLNSLTTDYKTELSTDTSNLEANYTTRAEKDNIIKALNNVDLDYLFSLKLEQLTNNFKGEYSSLNDFKLLISPNENLNQLVLANDYGYYFYFDNANNVKAIELYDLKKILDTEKLGNNFDDIQNILGKNQVVSIKTKYKNFENTEAALIYDIDKYSYLFLSYDIDGTDCHVLICKTEDKKLSEISNVRKEFRNDLPNIIISQKDKISKFFEDASNNWYEITDNYIIIDIAEGDLNNDGKNDFAVVAQQENTYMLNSDELRWIYVFEQNNDGNYKLSHLNKNIVPNVMDGGPFGDPFSGISIKNSILSVADYGGSAWKGSNIYNFKYDNNDLVLKQYEFSNIFDARGEIHTYNFENGYFIIEIFSENVPPENEKIFETTFKNKKINFDNFNIDEILNNRFYLPSLGEYNFYSDYKELKTSPQEALDNIKNLYYSDMEKVYIPWTEETKKNYSKAIGYEVPDYYYKNDEAILSYSQIKDTNIYLEHAITYERENSSYKDYKSYYISDSTGTVQIGG